MSLEFRFAHSDEYAPVAQFINDHWAKGHIYYRSEPLFRWTFGRPGHWEHEGFSVAVAVTQGELVGVLGGIPFTFNRFGDSARGIWLANYIIREDHRRGPAALRLLSMMRGGEFAATVAFGINPATANIYRVLRGQVLPAAPRHVGVLPECADRMVNLLQIAHPDWTSTAARELAERYAIAQPGIDGPSGSTIPDSWDMVDWKAISVETIGAARDREYLEWRYRQHPIFEYRFLTVAEGQRTGLLVWRLETIHRETSTGREPIDLIGRVVEVLPASEQNARLLLSCFVQQLRAAGAFGADYYGYHGQTSVYLQAAGFRRATVEDADGIPSRFQPLDGKGGSILSAGFWPAGTPA